MIPPRGLSRRRFLQGGLLAGAGACSLPFMVRAREGIVLPAGAAPEALGVSHFASRMQILVWRNWQLVPLERMAATIGASIQNLRDLGQSLGLGEPPTIAPEIQRRSFITVIRRNWHLLPYDQLLLLLDWSAEELAFTLREDDFLFIKLGSLKPQCEPLRWTPPTETEQARAAAIARIVREEFGQQTLIGDDPLFSFVRRLSTPPPSGLDSALIAELRKTPPRYCYSYFALYGDALLDPNLDPYPDGYLARLAASGVNGVWLQALLATLSPFPWDTSVSARYEERRAQLRSLIARAARYGIKVFLYLNEPRARPLGFFASRPELKGVAEGDYATLCTSTAAVRHYLTETIESLCRAVPGIGGFFTISASENLTNCWSHHRGDACPRCGVRRPAEVIAEFHEVLLRGIHRAGGGPRLIAWDWGWSTAWSTEVIQRLPDDVSLQSVSEWDVPIERGGVASRVGEYSLSAIGPGPRARDHWATAGKRGLSTLAKIQAANSWELASVPFIPAIAQAWQHGRNLREEGVEGLMLGWTLGGHPSPNLEAAIAGLNGDSLETVARRRHGDHLASTVVEAWRGYSRAFRKFPFHIGCVYHAPWQMGPANLLWTERTGYSGTMVGLPYDDVTRWRAIYPLETWCAQLQIVAEGFRQTTEELRDALSSSTISPELAEEMRFAEACAIHWRSAATQARWIACRDAGEADTAEARELLHNEITHARSLHALQSADSRIGFEASNHYFYVPLDLVEKAVNCRWLLEGDAPAVQS